MITPLFERDGQRLVATALAAGPWDPEHSHGGATSALLAHLIEGVDALAPMTTVRLTVDLRSPVTRAPLTNRTEVLRQGRRVQLVGAALINEQGNEVSTATALRIRRDDIEIPADGETSPEPPTVGPDDLPRFRGNQAWQAGFFDAADLRLPEGALGTPGAASGWVRLLAPVLGDEPVTALSRVAAAGDFGNGISAPLPMEHYLFINPDLTIAIDRPPVDEWVGVSSRSTAQPTGIGRTVTDLTDLRGPIGTALQSLYVAER